VKVTKKVAPLFLLADFFSVFCFILILKPEPYESSIILSSSIHSNDILKIRNLDHKVLDNDIWIDLSEEQIKGLSNVIVINNNDDYKTYIVGKLKQKIEFIYFKECLPSNNTCRGKDIVIDDNLKISLKKAKHG